MGWLTKTKTASFQRSEMMARDTHIHNEVNKIDLRRIFREIRKDVEKATSRKDLTELYNQAGYMITLTHATPINEKFGGPVKLQRRLAEREFATTARKINNQAKKIGTGADYNEKWETLATNGYEAEGENLLEPQSLDK
jgi:hypothetical protein